jgi:hypothetical protein
MIHRKRVAAPSTLISVMGLKRQAARSKRDRATRPADDYLDRVDF